MAFEMTCVVKSSKTLPVSAVASVGSPITPDFVRSLAFQANEIVAMLFGSNDRGSDKEGFSHRLIHVY